MRKNISHLFLECFLAHFWLSSIYKAHIFSLCRNSISPRLDKKSFWGAFTFAAWLKDDKAVNNLICLEARHPQLKCSNVKISAVVLKLQHDLAKKVLHATEFSWPTICIIHCKKKTRSRWWLFAWLRINFIFFYFETVIHEFQAKCPYVFRKAIKNFDSFF